MRAKYNFILTYKEELPHKSSRQDAFIYPLADIMRHAGFKELIPINKTSRYGPIILGSIRQYLGSDTNTYFSFVAYLQGWLVFPMIVGLLTMAVNAYFDFTADDSPADFVYALVIMVWSIFFITRWEQNQKWAKVCEQSGYSDQWAEHQTSLEKWGWLARQSHISGDREVYIPLPRKILFHFVSISLCLLATFGTLVFMVLSLNARGFVDQDHKLLYFDNISAWARQGGIFQMGTHWALIPNLVHVIVTNGFDESVYRPLAKWCARFQRHADGKARENSIIVKFFAYEYIITFADLFYIAFVRLDIVGLREQLLTLFFIDIVRRIVAELLIPKIKNKYRAYSLKNSVAASSELELAHQAAVEVAKEDYEQFDDYLQIVTNFGYLVMISSCFPLAPTLILIAHAIEGLQDKYRLVHIFRRKLPRKYVGMGFWKTIVVFLCYTSIITNILLFAFSSHQIASFFPVLFQTSKDLIFGNLEITQLVQNAAHSVSQAASSVLSSVIDSSAVSSNITPYRSPLDIPLPIIKSFQPPAEEHQMEFITIIFIIEHVFLLLFICIRNILSKQECPADVLVKRRDLKRKIKKHLQRDILADQFRDAVVSEILTGTAQKSTLFNFLSTFLPTEGNTQIQKESEQTKLDQNRDTFPDVLDALSKKQK